MLKDLRCPVLLIHGRNDTMIPIQQSEKLWEAVYLKAREPKTDAFLPLKQDLSHFHTCDCGHNDARQFLNPFLKLLKAV